MSRQTGNMSVMFVKCENEEVKFVTSAEKYHTALRIKLS